MPASPQTAEACKVAAIQMVSAPDIATNLSEAERWVAEAAAAGAQLVALPEYFAFINADEQFKLQVCERDGAGPLQDFLAACAQRHRVWLVGGTVPLAGDQPGRVRNACLVYDDSGRRVARYDKVHLFGFQHGAERYDEAATIEPGRELVRFEGPAGATGLAVCYDLRFPELFRALGALDLLVLPAAFTRPTGAAHWEVLLRARAIENQCYVLAAAQGGEHASGRRTWGDSLLIDPWGEVLARRAEGAGVVLGDVSPARIREVRERLPALAHRRLS